MDKAYHPRMMMSGVLALLLLTPHLLSAQGSPIPVGRNQPLAFSTLAYTTEGRAGQTIAGVALSPLLVLFSMFPFTGAYDRGALLDIAAGTRSMPDGSSEIRWRFALLDVDSRRGAQRLEWRGDRSQSRPLLSRTLAQFRTGLTLVDYDRTRTPALDARWLELRLGYGIDIPIGTRAAVDIRPLVAGGITSLQPGSRLAEIPGVSADEILSGGEVGGSISIELRYEPLPELIGFLSLDASDRSLMLETALHRVTVGAALSLYTRSVASERNSIRTLFGTTLGVRLRYEREQIYFDGEMVDIDRMYAGIQHGFN